MASREQERIAELEDALDEAKRLLRSYKSDVKTAAPAPRGKGRAFAAVAILAAVGAGGYLWFRPTPARVYAAVRARLIKAAELAGGPVGAERAGELIAEAEARFGHRLTDEQRAELVNGAT